MEIPTGLQSVASHLILIFVLFMTVLYHSFQFNAKRFLYILDADADAPVEDINDIGASYPPFEGPPVQFATENCTVTTSQIGSTAFVPCVVNNIREGIVSMSI